jgi:hypothetical protein
VVVVPTPWDIDKPYRASCDTLGSGFGGVLQSEA